MTMHVHQYTIDAKLTLQIAAESPASATLLAREAAARLQDTVQSDEVLAEINRSRRTVVFIDKPPIIVDLRLTTPNLATLEPNNG